MRKYRQVLLVVVVICSVFFLLVYRNEYIKLRTTFEIINVFSKPVKPTDCLTLNETVPDSYLYRDIFSNPTPHWTRVGEHYVYSAFWQSDGNKQRARAIGVGPSDSTKNYQCGVWFDLQDSIYSLRGIFSYTNSVSSTNASLTFYEFICDIEVSSQGVPYMFVFSEKSGLERKKYLIPIFTAKLSKTGLHMNSTALCVGPDIMGRTKNEIIEFINFHQIIGLTDLIIYDIGIHYGILTKLKKLEGLMSFIRTISVLTWNLPFDDIYIWNKALEVDCIYRASGNVEVVSIINWNHYLIPSHNTTILSMVKEYRQDKMITFNIPVQLCCTDMKNEKHAESSWPLILRKCHCVKLPDFIIMILNPTINEYNERQSIKLSNGYVNLLDVCNNQQKSRSLYDSRLLDFFPDLMLNKLLRIWKSGVLFTQS